MDKDSIKELLERYEDGTASPEEVCLVEAWYQNYADGSAIYDLPTDADVLMQRDWERIQAGVRPRFNWKPLAVAASLVLAGFLGFMYYNIRGTGDEVLNSTTEVLDLDPGTNRATLKMANGQSIALSDQHAGIIMDHQQIRYNDGTNILDENSLETASTIELSTPRAGQYAITLSDGTKVWLNAETTLQYPSRFTGNDRRVVVDGEAYFEVAKNKSSSFTVVSAGQEIKVLGTAFNVNTYQDEGTNITTLVEGKVQILNTYSQELAVLKPQDQALIKADILQVKQVPVEDYIAWKNDVILFNQKSLRSILQTLSRWYDFQIDVDQVPKVSLSGMIPKNVKLSEVFMMLEGSSHVKFKLIESGANKEERRVVIDK